MYRALSTLRRTLAPPREAGALGRDGSRSTEPIAARGAANLEGPDHPELKREPKGRAGDISFGHLKNVQRVRGQVYSDCPQVLINGLIGMWLFGVPGQFWFLAIFR